MFDLLNNNAYRFLAEIITPPQSDETHLAGGASTSPASANDTNGGTPSDNGDQMRQKEGQDPG